MTTVLPAAVQAAGGELELRTVDKTTGELTPARMHLKDQRGRPVRVPGYPYWNDHFVFPGKVILKLNPGTYTFEIERGPEYRTHHGHFIIEPNAADNKQVELERFVDMKAEGWWSGDLHIHRGADEIQLLMLAEDLHVGPVITWWNDENTWADRPLPEKPLVQFDVLPLSERAGYSDRPPPEKPLVPFDGKRFAHLLTGKDEREGGALLFFNLTEPLPLAGSGREFPSSVHFLKLARREPAAHVDIEKPFGWDMPIWIASGMAHSIGLANSHLQRDQMLASEAWGKPRDRLRYPDPHGNGLWSQDIYYHLLNCGLRIPPSAGSASGVVKNPVGYNRVYVHCGEELTYDAWWEGLRSGRVVVTNGPLIRPRVNGQLPGHVFDADTGETVELSISLNLSLRDKVDYLEVVKDGQVVHEVRLDEYAKAGGQLPPVVFTESGWMLIRAVTNHPKTYRFASTGPYYVQIGSQPRISKASAQFFVDWVHERARRVQLEDAEQRAAVLRYHRAARDFWQAKLDAANAD